jgi:hypothetical protein
VVRDSFASPSLAFQTEVRDRAQTAAARIDLATTLLVVDAAGTYRGLQEYRVTNATEQFLEIRLPEGARLWTASVAGQPVKPVVPPQAAGAAAAAGRVRIPLVKTAEGEGDYPVQLKYGGRMPPLASLSQVRFPLMRTVNINVELSQVTLRLPDEYDWSSYFEFGGTMRSVADEGELAEVYQSYLNKRIQEAKELLSSANPYTQIRAQSNLRQARILFDTSRSMSANNLKQAAIELQTRNDLLLDDAERQVQDQQSAQRQEVGDNRERLNYYWAEQDVKRSKNVVSGLKSNFDGASLDMDGEKAKAAAEDTFNKSFFDQNALGTKAEGDLTDAEKQLAGSEFRARGSGKSASRSGGGQQGDRFYRNGKEALGDLSQPQGYEGGQQGQSQNPQLFNDQQRDALQRKLQMEADLGRSDEPSSTRREMDNLSRYGANLERSAQQQEQGGLAFQQRQHGAQQPAQPGSGFGYAPPQMSSGGASGMMGGMGGFGGGVPQGTAPSRGYNSISGPLAAGQPANAPGTDPLAIPESGLQNEYAGASVGRGEAFGNLAAGLASLDVDIPQRGSTFSFTTPRGQIEVTARPVAQSLVARMFSLTGLAAVVLVVWLASRKPAREQWQRLCSTVSCGVLLAVVGLLSVVTGIFPVTGLLLIAGGIALAIRNRRFAPPAPASAA